ncbi:response regulator [Streptomyces sp. NPDC058299]|uniref:response regulator transcription factor n=1 Tax=unclassified Streptomyces TaxID=2593676 RepID=UPI0036EE997C
MRRPSAPAVRLLLADDHDMILTSLAAALHAVEDFTVVAAVSRSEEVLPAAVRTRPTVAVLDHAMPGRTGLELAGDLMDVLPGCRIALVTAVPQRSLARSAVAQGVLSVVPKSTPFSHLVDTIRSVAAGRLTIEADLLCHGSRTDSGTLNQREAEILKAIATGASLGEVATHLNLAPGTVRNLSSALIKKLGARNRFDAARIAAEAGWI